MKHLHFAMFFIRSKKSSPRERLKQILTLPISSMTITSTNRYRVQHTFLTSMQYNGSITDIFILSPGFTIPRYKSPLSSSGINTQSGFSHRGSSSRNTRSIHNILHYVIVTSSFELFITFDILMWV